ncbi:hypothetical protein [Enterococcus villorum]|uniref:hypothetical protein n=1 Tax=Enterococcus villorum TaxID=112904 RepID=UPI003B8479AE
MTANPFTIGIDGNITGTYDSRPTNEVDSIRLMVDGVVTKLVKYGEGAFPKIGNALSDIYIENRWKSSS